MYIKGILVCLFLVTCAAFGVYSTYIPKAQVNWDEAAILLWGYTLHEALIDLNFTEVYSLMKQQVYYPPLHSWFIALTSFMFGFSVTTARAVNLFWLFASSLLIYHVCYSFFRKTYSWLIGVLAVCLYVLAPMTLIHSSVVLKELMGTALTLISYVTFSRAETKNSKTAWCIAGIFWSLIFFFKYHYALILLAAYALIQSYDYFHNKNSYTSSLLVFWGFVISSITGWVLFQRTAILPGYVFAQLSMTADIGTWYEKLLFYPRSIVYLYSFSRVLGYVLLLALVGSAFYRSNRKLNEMKSILAVYIVFMSLYWNNLHDRYIFTVVPFVYIVAAHTITETYRKLSRNINQRVFRNMTVLLCILGIFILGKDVYALPLYVYSAGAHSLRYPMFNQLDYRDAIFDYRVQSWPRQMPNKNSQSQDDVIQYVFSVVDPRKGIRFIGTSNTLSPKYWQLSKRMRSGCSTCIYDDVSGYQKYVVTIEILPSSRLYDRDFYIFNKKNQDLIPEIRSNPEYLLLGENQFSDLGVVVSIYGYNEGFEK